jgi:hypothetical protein
VTAREIAEAVGLSKRAVQLNLDTLGDVFAWKKSPTGQEKHYPITLLPEEYRVAVMAKRATAECTGTDCIVGQIGADAAKAILAARAEEKERELIAKEQGLEAFERLPEQRRNEAKARLGLLQLCDGFIKAAGFAIPRHAQRSKKADRAFVEAYNEGRINVPKRLSPWLGNRPVTPPCGGLRTTTRNTACRGWPAGTTTPRKGAPH